jgi:transcriptional/translational regulatory protein YebC/TACO1
LPEVRSAFVKHGGNMAEKGAVAFQFERKAMIRVKASGDDLVLQAIDAGAEDVEEDGPESVIYTDPKLLAEVRDKLKDQGLEIVDAELTYVPNNTVKIEDQATAGKIIRLMEALDEVDDVTNTYTNFDIPDNLIDS